MGHLPGTMGHLPGTINFIDVAYLFQLLFVTLCTLVLYLLPGELCPWGKIPAELHCTLSEATEHIFSRPKYGEERPGKGEGGEVESLDG